MSKLPRYWFHGDTSLRTHLFRDQVWDRNRTQQTLNAEGPGIYWTSSEDDARSYGPYLYRAELRPGFKVLPRRKPSMAFVLAIFSEAPEEDKEIFLSNWATESPRVALKQYTYADSLHDAAVQLYGDLIRSPAAWVQAMRNIGYDGVVVDKPKARIKHLVVWSSEKLDVWHIQE